LDIRDGKQDEAGENFITKIFNL